MKLNIDTIRENRSFKHIDIQEAELLIDTLYEFSVIAFNAYTNVNKHFNKPYNQEAA